MTNVPPDLKYAKSHEWVRLEGDIATIGITDHAQKELTDLVFIELPDKGRFLHAGDSCAVVESVKTASEIYAPLEGEVADSNSAVVDDPAKVNGDPYGVGWLFKIKLQDPAVAADLLDADGYRALIGDEG